MTTSLSATLKLINDELDAERNESLRIDERNFHDEGNSSKMNNLRSNNYGATTMRVQNDAASKTVESEPEDREHVQLFEKIYDLFSLYAKFIGIITKYDWVPHKYLMFWFSMFLVAAAWSQMLYTQSIYIKNGEILRLLEVFAMYGIVISCTQKIFSYLKKRQHILSLFFSIRSICRKTVPGNRAEILTTNLRRTYRFLRIYAVGVVFCLGFFAACPFKLYYFDDELMSLLPLEIMYVDQSTYTGYVVGNVLMAFLGLYAALGTILYGATFIFAVFMYSMYINLIEQDFKDLDNMWMEDSTVPIAYRRQYLANICSKRQDITDFMNAIKFIFETKFMFYFCVNYLSQVICLFEVATNQWLAGYPLAMVLFMEMMFYCVMGSQITMADERLCFIICTSNWYSYDVKSQKMIKFLLHRSQQLNQLNLGPLGPLTVVTGVEVIKNIYTYYTVLTEVL